MSLYLDQKYLSLISNQLPLFKKKSDHLYNCRCVICGDSLKNKRKTRGYIFPYKNELRYKCHNCDVSLTFGNLLKQIDSLLYSQYSLERYLENKVSEPVNMSPGVVFEQPTFKSKEEKLFDRLMDRVDTLPEDNEVVQYCLKRQIPRNRFTQLYFIDNIKNIIQLNDNYKESIKTEESRLVLPFYDNSGSLTGLTCRAIHGEALRYITIKIKEDTPLIFGINNIDTKKRVYVVEGPIDSLFLDNCIAVSGTSFNKINMLGIDTSQLVLIFDNQPRNKEVCKIIEKNIDLGYNVVIWPQGIEEKDVNEMILANRNVKCLVDTNIVSGLVAKAKFMAWKRC